MKSVLCNYIKLIWINFIHFETEYLHNAIFKVYSYILWHFCYIYILNAAYGVSTNSSVYRFMHAWENLLSIMSPYNIIYSFPHLTFNFNSLQLTPVKGYARSSITVLSSVPRTLKTRHLLNNTAKVKISVSLFFITILYIMQAFRV